LRTVKRVRTTIILLSTDEARLLPRSLRAALAQEPRPEVVVVDNGSTDETAAIAEQQGAGYLRLEPSRSYAAAINDALAQTGGEAVVLLNADCFLRPGFLATALPHLRQDRVGSVAPKLVRVDDAGAELGELDAAGMFVNRHRKNGLVGYGRPAGCFATAGEAFGCDGAAAIYRRDTLEDCALGGREVLDEDMELWASDADLAWRAQLFGWRCAYEPRAVAAHIRTYSPGTRPRMSEGARRLQFRNRYLMIAKNETGAGLRRDGLAILGYELLALGHVLLRERHLLAGYRDAWKLLPAARRRRSWIQARRRNDRPPFGLRARG
jgi:GT2 family glycosyltransferase